MKLRNLPWLPIVFGTLGLLCLPFFGSMILAFIDPAAHNYRLDYLEEGEAVDGYLHTGEYRVTIIFHALLLAFLVFALIMSLLRKKSPRIIEVGVGTLLFAAFALTRAIWAFQNGGVTALTGVFNLVAFAGALGCLAFFTKKQFDGDCQWPYYLCLIVTLIGIAFGSATQHSYSVLNSLGHQGDTVFWSGYSITRLMILTFAFLAYVNSKTEYEPTPISE